MPKYRVLQTSFIGNSLVNEGDIVDYDGKAGDNLELLDKKSKSANDKAAQAASEANPSDAASDAAAAEANDAAIAAEAELAAASSAA